MRPRRTGRWIVLAAILSALATLGIAGLLTTIFERRQEARNPFYRVVELNDTTIDPAIWGKNFPQQYDDYRKTVDMVYTRYGGSEATPRTPTAIDPRRVVSQSRLAGDPRLMKMWAGYAFAHDFREERGHAYMLDDQVFTRRQQASPQPGACLHCHASMYVAYTRAGGGDLIKGFVTNAARGTISCRTRGPQIANSIDGYAGRTAALKRLAASARTCLSISWRMSDTPGETMAQCCSPVIHRHTSPAECLGCLP